MSSNVFCREALKDLFNFFTKGSNSMSSFKVPHHIDSGGAEETWCTIHMGATAAIRWVDLEFQDKLRMKDARDYLRRLEHGKSKTRLLISVKGTHHPLNESSMIEPGKSLSLIDNICLYN